MARQLTCNKSFSRDYMLLNPEDVKILDLIRILLYRNIEKRNFVDTTLGKEESFEYRWLIFVSILGQKFLQSVSRPLAWSGSKLEMWLNLCSSNGNVGGLLLNLLRGRMVVPDKESATFLSFIGNLDQRTELDEKIKHGDSRYHAALSVMASKISYENTAYIENIVTNHWKMEFLGSFDFWNDYQGKATTQAFILRDKNIEPELTVVAFRGTETFDADAWCTDLDLSWYELASMGKVHGGFMKALGLKKNLGWPKNHLEDESSPPPAQLAYYAIRKILNDVLGENPKGRFIVTGHSLGGALAVLFPAILTMHEEEWLLERMEGVYTFGQPRVGDEKFGKVMMDKLAKHGIRYFRFVYGNDIVPRLPYDDSTLMFKHFGTCLYYNSSYMGKVVPEEPNKNYFSPKWAIPKTINATWELIRSFTIRHTRGPEYKEGWVLRFMRIVGLIIAGIPAHSPQDYVNSTRLGSSDVFYSVPIQKEIKAL